MNKKVEEMTIEELKIIGYDQILQLEQIKQNLAIIQNEIQKRQEVKDKI